MAAKTFAMACTVALPLILVRHMSQAEFGLYKQAFLVVTTAYTILPLGFSLSAFYFFPREPARKSGVVLHIILFHTFVGVAAAAWLALQPELVSALFRHGDLEQHGAELAVLILLMCASTFLEFVAIANQETRLAAILIAVLQMTRAMALVSAAVVWGTLSSLLAAAILHGVFQLGVSLAYAGSRFRNVWRGFDRSLLLSQLAYAMPYGAAALLWWVRMDLHHYWVAYQFSAAEYAIYAVGCFQLPLLGILRESIGGVMIPRVSELQQASRRAEILDLLARSARRLATFYLPVAAGAVVLAPEIIALLFTRQYADSVPIFMINAALIPLATIALASDAVLRAYAEHRYYVLRLRAVLTVLLVLGLWVLVDRFGLLGAILAVAGFELAERAIMGWKTGAILGVTRADLGFFRDIGKVSLATLGATGVAVIVRGGLSEAAVLVVLAAVGLAFSATYVLLLLALAVPTEDERDFVRRQLGRLSWLRGTVVRASHGSPEPPNEEPPTRAASDETAWPRERASLARLQGSKGQRRRQAARRRRGERHPATRAP
jgi:O-antigen/teichoic acid export membrane protein